MPLISSIPDNFQEGFKILSSLDEDVFNSIQKALLEVPATSSVENLAESVMKITNLERKEIEQIFRSIEGLFLILDSENEIEEFANDVSKLFDKSGINGRDEFKNRLIILLKEKKIFYASKAYDLITESGNFFIQCRVMTDIRPIFDLDVESQPKAGIIMHTLHIHYDADSGPQRDIYLTLEPSDLETIKDALVRADKKQKALSETFKASGMINLNC
jgi:hypothetical protein